MKTSVNVKRFMVNGLTVDVVVEDDADAAQGPVVSLVGVDCDLEGIEPGRYCPVPIPPGEVQRRTR